MTPEELHLISRVRTCPNCPTCAAEAAHLLGEPTTQCPICGFRLLPGHPCLCQTFEPGNPAAAHFHEKSAA